MFLPDRSIPGGRQQGEPVFRTLADRLDNGDPFQGAPRIDVRCEHGILRSFANEIARKERPGNRTCASMPKKAGASAEAPHPAVETARGVGANLCVRTTQTKPACPEARPFLVAPRGAGSGRTGLSEAWPRQRYLRDSPAANAAGR